MTLGPELVAGRAISELLGEEQRPAARRLGQRVVAVLAAQALVIAGVEAREPGAALEGRDAVGGGVEHARGVVEDILAEKPLEGGDVVGILGDALGDRAAVRHAHLDATEQRTLGLIGQGARATVEEKSADKTLVGRLLAVETLAPAAGEFGCEARVRRRGRVAIAQRRAVVAARYGAYPTIRIQAVIDQGVPGIVAAGAGQAAVQRQVGVVEQAAPEGERVVEYRGPGGWGRRRGRRRRRGRGTAPAAPAATGGERHAKRRGAQRTAAKKPHGACLRAVPRR